MPGLSSMKLNYIFGIATLFFLVSCNDDVKKSLEPRSSALGVMNEIVVICDNDMWEGAVGDTFRFYFESAYPIMPQPEPLFDLRHFSVKELQIEPMRKELRTYAILADLSDENSPTTRMVKTDLGAEKFNAALADGTPVSSVGRDKWARGQVLFYLFGKDREALSQSIVKNFAAVARRVNKHDEKQLHASVYARPINKGLTNQVAERFGLRVDIPGDFKVATSDEAANVLWLRKDTKEAIVNVVFQTLPYSSTKQLERNEIIQLRNRFGKKYVESDSPSDYMVVNEDDLPVYEYKINIDEHYAIELRGIWEMTEAFVAGPFTTYMILNEKANRIIYVDTFVFAPGEEKRDYMQQLNHMVRSAKLVEQL